MKELKTPHHEQPWPVSSGVLERRVTMEFESALAWRPGMDQDIAKYALQLQAEAMAAMKGTRGIQQAVVTVTFSITPYSTVL